MQPRIVTPNVVKENKMTKPNRDSYCKKWKINNYNPKTKSRSTYSILNAGVANRPTLLKIPAKTRNGFKFGEQENV